MLVASSKEEGVACEGCGGAGWLLCDFCEGKNNNVKSEGQPGVPPLPDLQSRAWLYFFLNSEFRPLLPFHRLLLFWIPSYLRVRRRRRRDSSCARDAGCTSASPTRRATSHDGRPWLSELRFLSFWWLRCGSSFNHTDTAHSVVCCLYSHMLWIWMPGKCCSHSVVFWNYQYAEHGMVFGSRMIHAHLS